MDKPTSQAEKPKDGRRYDPYLQKKGLRCDLDQYDFLKQSSEKGEEGIKEWNKWRSEEENRHKDIHLEGVPLAECYLANVDLRLKGTSEVFLTGADLKWAKLQGAKLMGTHLEEADMRFARLEDADVSDAHLESTQCARAVVDYTTSLWECKVNRKTDFLGVNLDAAKIDPATKQLLEYNIRRMNWEQWYKEHWIQRWPVRWFWLLSDYGLRTWWIIAWFLGFAFGFAIIYLLWGLISPPGIVDYLFVDANGEKVAWWIVPCRAVHFSVVIMTVGFTDIHANAHSFWAHILVGLQMILGYVLLGALVTRFAVLFTAGGPAGKFVDEKTTWERLKEWWNRIKKKG